MPTNPLVLIPARLGSTRLPGKPLADIAGKPMIVHVLERALEADLGRAVVATDADEVRQVIEAAGGEVVMTHSDHQSGSDRIFEAMTQIDPDHTHDAILGVQGDLPLIEPEPLQAVLHLLDDPAVDIGTAAAVIIDDEERTNPHVVKVVGTPVQHDRLRALYFTRATAPYGDGPLYHHVGLYGYQRAALERFVSLPPSTLEVRESLEQLRALEAGMRIDAALVANVPVGVDTPDDLEQARRVMAARSS